MPNDHGDVEAELGTKRNPELVIMSDRIGAGDIIGGEQRYAQVGAILVLLEFEDRENKIPFFSAIEYAKFRRPVVPGDTLMLEVTALRVGSRVQKMRGVASVDGQVAAEAEILSIIANRGE